MTDLKALAERLNAIKSNESIADEPYLTDVERATIDQAARLIAGMGEVCWCETCRPMARMDVRFIVCPDCGNKRCPRATNHSNACTNSNEPGQPGSSWEHVKPAAAQEGA